MLIPYKGLGDLNIGLQSYTQKFNKLSPPQKKKECLPTMFFGFSGWTVSFGVLGHRFHRYFLCLRNRDRS